jgi:polysaccharide biosynthesis transport protein
VELREILGVLRRFWPVALGALVACLAVAAAVAGLSPKRYEATATLSVRPRPAGNVELVEFLLPSLEARAESRSLRQVLRSPAGGGGGGDPELDAVTTPGTGVMRIVVRGTDQETLAPLANSVARHLQRALQQSTVLSITVLDPAVRPSGPMAPATLPLLLSGLVLGAIMAVWGALAAQWISRRRRTAARVCGRLGVPVLGTIPRPATQAQAGGWPSAQQLLHGPNGELVEACQELRATTEVALTARQVRSLAVAGVRNRDAAVGIAAMLGWSLAAVGHRVLLVDGDLRRPALGRALGGTLAPVEPPNGLALLRVAEAPGLPLHLLPAGSLRQLGRGAAGLPAAQAGDQHPAETLTIGLSRLLRAPGGSDRLTVVGTPPLDVVDSRLVASMTGAAIVVVDAGRRAALTALEQGVARLRDAGVEVLGVVLVRRPRRLRRGATPPGGLATSRDEPSVELEDQFAGTGFENVNLSGPASARAGRRQRTTAGPARTDR